MTPARMNGATATCKVSFLGGLALYANGGRKRGQEHRPKLI